MPKSILNGSPRHKVMWTRSRIMSGAMQIRDKILRETGEDIFSAFIMPDCVEINLKGEYETTKREVLVTPVKPKKYKRRPNQKRKRMAREAEAQKG